MTKAKIIEVIVTIAGTGVVAVASTMFVFHGSIATLLERTSGINQQLADHTTRISRIEQGLMKFAEAAKAREDLETKALKSLEQNASINRSQIQGQNWELAHAIGTTQASYWPISRQRIRLAIPGLPPWITIPANAILNVVAKADPPPDTRNILWGRTMDPDESQSPDGARIRPNLWEAYRKPDEAPAPERPESTPEKKDK